ncbi:MAG: M13 family peptidase, partial [Bacteroidales bacterium]|nr:M13 family peptidase [Bacteroidales bacterium]
PDDKTRYGAFDELAEKNREKLKTLILDAMNDKNAPEGSNKKKICDFYASGMDSVKRNEERIKELKPYFEKISQLTSKEEVIKMAAELQTVGITPFFHIYASPDEKNSSMVIANTWQAGLGLPNRDYYTNNDERSENIRKEYVQYIQNIYKLLGKNDEEAKQLADKIMKLETKLAEVSFTNLENRDPQATYNKMSVEDLQKTANGFDWELFINSLGYPEIDSINIAQVKFAKGLGELFTKTTLEDWKVFLNWKVINKSASYLSDDFVQEDFNFYSKSLLGQKQITPRWKRIQNQTNAALGEAIGQVYVEKYFPPEAKKKITDLVANLKKALEIRINNLQWMSEPTKKAALEKLAAINVKVGYPDKWRDYSGLKVSRDSYVKNIMASNKFNFEYMMNKIGKPVDKDEWGMTPQTVNAYYSPNRNEIVFPAAILQPPFFNVDADDAVNYGAIGVVIGHETTHGFDDQGRQYDKNGNLNDWWTDEDAQKYKEQTNKLVEQYNGFVAIDSMHVNGELTLGENIADFGGLTIALEAFKIDMKEKGIDPNEKIDGFTPIQRFFLSYATIWRQNIRDKELKNRLENDVHSSGRYRVNGALFNVPEFYEAFNIKEGDKLYRTQEQRPIIW